MHKWRTYFCLHDEKFNLWSIMISSCIGHVQLMHWQKIPIQFPEVQIGCVLNQFSILVEWYILAAINYETIYLTFKIIGHILWQDKSQKSDQFSRKMLPVTMMALKWNYLQDLTPPTWRGRGRPISTRVSKGCWRRDASQLWLTQTHRNTHTNTNTKAQTQRHTDTQTGTHRVSKGCRRRRDGEEWCVSTPAHVIPAHELVHKQSLCLTLPPPIVFNTIQ